MAVIKTLKENGRKIYPITSSECVFTPEGKTVDALITEKVRELPERIGKVEDDVTDLGSEVGQVKTEVQSIADNQTTIADIERAMQSLPDGSAVSAQVAMNTAKVSELENTINGELTGSVGLSQGKNEILNIGDVAEGDTINVTASLSFAAEQDWYLSFFSNGTQIGDATRVNKSKSSVTINKTFESSYQSVFVCISAWGTLGTASVMAKLGLSMLQRISNAENKVSSVSDDVAKIEKKLVGFYASKSMMLHDGRNDLIPLGDVASGASYQIQGTLDFTPSGKWYVSIQSSNGEVLSKSYSESVTSFDFKYAFDSNKNGVVVAVSTWGNLGNATVSVKQLNGTIEGDVKKAGLISLFGYIPTEYCNGGGSYDNPFVSADGTAGFETCMQLAKDRLGGKIFVPSGQYLISTPINIPFHCINIEGAIWNYPSHPNGVYESNWGAKIKIASQNIPAIKIETGNGIRLSQLGIAGTIPNGDTKGTFSMANIDRNCGILFVNYHDQYEIRRVSCVGLAAGFVCNEGAMDAGIIECFNADGCNFGIVCIVKNTTCYYPKIMHNVLSDCPAAGIYIDGLSGSVYRLRGAEICGNILVRNGGGFTPGQVEELGGEDECASVVIKGLYRGSFHDNIIHNTGTFNNPSSGSIVQETQQRRNCILDGQRCNINNNEMLGSTTSSFVVRGFANNIVGNNTDCEILTEGDSHNINGNFASKITINGSYCICTGNKCGNYVVNGNNNNLVIPTNATLVDNGSGNTITRI